jgi:hypothetical protein
MSDCCAEILTCLVAAGADVIERVARPGVSSRGRSTHVWTSLKQFPDAIDNRRPWPPFRDHRKWPGGQRYVCDRCIADALKHKALGRSWQQRRSKAGGYEREHGQCPRCLLDDPHLETSLGERVHDAGVERRALCSRKHDEPVVGDVRQRHPMRVPVIRQNRDKVFSRIAMDVEAFVSTERWMHETDVDLIPRQRRNLLIGGHLDELWMDVRICLAKPG